MTKQEIATALRKQAELTSVSLNTAVTPVSRLCLRWRRLSLNHMQNSVREPLTWVLEVVMWTQ